MCVCVLHQILLCISLPSLLFCFFGLSYWEGDASTHDFFFFWLHVYISIDRLFYFFVVLFFGCCSPSPPSPPHHTTHDTHTHWK